MERREDAADVDKVEKGRVIASANTVVEPLAVVIKVAHTFVAQPAVLAALVDFAFAKTAPKKLFARDLTRRRLQAPQRCFINRVRGRGTHPQDREGREEQRIDNSRPDLGCVVMQRHHEQVKRQNEVQANYPCDKLQLVVRALEPVNPLEFACLIPRHVFPAVAELE